MSKSHVIVVLPAFNEELVIGEVIDRVINELSKINNICPQLIVVDDGSTDETNKIVLAKGVEVIKHVINRGLGGSIMTGLEYARMKQADVLVTMDADGQHNPKNIYELIKPIVEQQYDVVIGSRFLGKSKNLNIIRKLILKGGNLITYLLFGIYSSDSQSGFRAFSKRAINSINLRTQRMEVSSELFIQIKKNKLRLTEVPIEVKYTPYSMAKGQSNLNAFRILLKLILRFGR